MPIEAVSTISWPAMLIGARSERRTCSASMASSRGSDWLSSSSANWSPPTRASVSCGPRLRPRRRATVSSRLSPTTRPNAVLTVLNLSMSMNSSAGRTSGSSVARLAAIASRSRNSSRLGRPVRLSCTASCSSRSCARLRVGDLAQQADAAQVAAVGARARWPPRARTSGRSCRRGACGTRCASRRPSAPSSTTAAA